MFVLLNLLKVFMLKTAQKNPHQNDISLKIFFVHLSTVIWTVCLFITFIIYNIEISSRPKALKLFTLIHFNINEIIHFRPQKIILLKGAGDRTQMNISCILKIFIKLHCIIS